MAEEAQTPDIEAVVQQIATLDADEFAKALQKASQPHWQRIFNAGHQTAKSTYEQKERELAKKLEEMQAAITEREEKIKALSEEAPDLAELKAKYEAALSKKDQEWQKKEAEWREREKTLATTIQTKEVGRFQAEVIGYLKDDVLDPEYARIRVNDPALAQRIRFTDAGEMQVYQADGVTPYSVAEGDSVAKILAQEILKTVPELLRKDRRPGSSNYNNGRSGTGGAPTGKKRSEMNPAEKLAFINEHGQAAYDALPLK